jgi:lipopolysaccharide/colanic/teichoic acid biosynthesis glycosyltransferase
VAGSALTATWPVLAGTAAVIRATMGKPVLFRQRRPGYRGRIFTAYKFRTMRETYDASGAPLPDGERLTRAGRFIRRSSLDELPQLINVLKGDRSLVGPRPLLVRYLPRYSAEQMRRHEVLPGITGWAQINGRNATTWPERFAQDLYYVDNWSLALDVKILARTAWKVLASDGISQPGHETMPEFMGNEEKGGTGHHKRRTD